MSIPTRAVDTLSGYNGKRENGETDIFISLTVFKILFQKVPRNKDKIAVILFYFISNLKTLHIILSKFLNLQLLVKIYITQIRFLHLFSKWKRGKELQIEEITVKPNQFCGLDEKCGLRAFRSIRRSQKDVWNLDLNPGGYALRLFHLDYKTTLWLKSRYLLFYVFVHSRYFLDILPNWNDFVVRN